MRARSSAKKSTKQQAEPEQPPEPPIPKEPDYTPDKSKEDPDNDIPGIPEAYDPIVSTIFSIDAPETIYEQIEAAIRPIRASRADYGTIVDALDRAQEVARLSMQLLVNAKITAAAHERDTEVAMSGFRDSAVAALQEEKAAGTRNKAITDADVTSRIAGAFPDDWNEVQDNRARIKRMIEYLEDLHERAKERARDLRTMTTNART